MKEIRILHSDGPRRQALCSLCGFWCMSRWFVNDKPTCPDCARDAFHHRRARIRIRRERAQAMWARQVER
jgi:hypothetical protein